jgi:hypothetical protein
MVMAVSVVLAGCGQKTRPYDDYISLNNTRYSYHNSINVGEFTYSAMQARGMRSDQIENTAIRNWYFGTSVAGLVRMGTIAELRNAGLMIRDDADIVLEGDVTIFKAADLGFTIDWSIGVMYTISKKSTKERLFSRHYAPPVMTTPKGPNQAAIVEYMHKMIAAACDRFMRDPEVRDILDAPAR